MSWQADRTRSLLTAVAVLGLLLVLTVLLVWMIVSSGTPVEPVGVVEEARPARDQPAPVKKTPNRSSDYKREGE